MGADALAMELPHLPDIPTSVQAAHPELAAQREALLRERALLYARVRRQNAQCSAVEEGSAAETVCLQSLKALRADIEEDASKSSRFIERLRNASVAPDYPVQTKPAAMRPADSRLSQADSQMIKQEIAGTQQALRRLQAAMNLDASQREEWVRESNRASRDAWIEAGSMTLDLMGAHVDHQITDEDSEVKRSWDLLVGTTDTGRRERLENAFKVLSDRKADLNHLRSSIRVTRKAYDNAASIVQTDEAGDSKLEFMLESIWNKGVDLKIIPPSAGIAKMVVDDAYLIKVQLVSLRRINDLNGNSERYLAAVKALRARMKALITAQKSLQNSGEPSR